MSLQVGSPAPDFTKQSHRGAELHLGALCREHRAIVLYFYPKDETPGCTAQACGFRDRYEDFLDLGAVVIGVSSDAEASHTSFASHHDLPFHLLSDSDGELRRAYGVKRSLGILPGRVTFIIDGSGVVRHRFESQLRVNRHIDGALEIVRALAAQKQS